MPACAVAIILELLDRFEGTGPSGSTAKKGRDGCRLVRVYPLDIGKVDMRRRVDAENAARSIVNVRTGRVC